MCCVSSRGQSYREVVSKSLLSDVRGAGFTRFNPCLNGTPRKYPRSLNSKNSGQGPLISDSRRAVGSVPSTASGLLTVSTRTWHTPVQSGHSLASPTEGLKGRFHPCHHQKRRPIPHSPRLASQVGPAGGRGRTGNLAGCVSLYCFDPERNLFSHHYDASGDVATGSDPSCPNNRMAPHRP